MLLKCAAFDETVQVPTNWVAKTPELHKKTNSLRGTAGPSRAAVIAAMAKDKEKSVSKLTFMDQPIGSETQPKPQPKPVKSGAAKLVILQPVSLLSSQSSHSSEELEVFISFKLLCPLLTNSFSTGDSIMWSLFPQEEQGSFHCWD